VIPLDLWMILRRDLQTPDRNMTLEMTLESTRETTREMIGNKTERTIGRIPVEMMEGMTAEMIVGGRIMTVDLVTIDVLIIGTNGHKNDSLPKSTWSRRRRL
jgi:hypothetical protein